MKKVLFFLLIILLTLHCKDQPHSFLLMFTGQGTYYKLEVSSKHVEWYNSLGTNLLSFQLSSPQDTEQQNSYILPTLDGHFLYIDAQSQILVQYWLKQIDRQQVEQLLSICFQGHSRSSINELSRYFIYEKHEYYIINLNNGNAQDLQTFLKNPLPNKIDRMAVLKVSKKFLKQLKQDLSVAWSTISSEIDLVPAQTFIKNPKASSSTNKDSLANSNLKFKRIGNNEIELINRNQSFEIGGSSHIIGIFEFIDSQTGYLKHPMEYRYRPKLALEHISNGQSKQLSQLARKDSNKINFIHSEQVSRLRKNKKQPKELQYCINTFRNLKALTDQSKPINRNTIPQLNIHKIEKEGNQSLTYPHIEITSAQQQTQYIIHYGPTEEQPYIWIALTLTIIAFAYWFYKMKINKLLDKFQIENDKRFQEFKKKLDKFESFQKMYEIFWDKLAYRVCGNQWYEHVVYQGKFLNQPTYVYAVRQQGTDIVSLQHKLNILLNSSHKGLAKLYYYTKNTQFLLIFTERIPLLSAQKLPEYLNFQLPINNKKSIISEIIEAVAYFDSKIEIGCLPYESVCLQKKQEGESETQLLFKLNPIPCLLKKPMEDSQQEDNSWSSENNTFELRINMTALFHIILHKGEKFNKQYIDELLKNQAYSQDEYLEFFDFVLYQVSRKQESNVEKQNDAQLVQNSRVTMFKDILDHPFLWDSKRKILFLSDFSNYIETHIDQSKVKKLESHAKDYNVIKTPWIKQFHFLFVREVNNYRKYDFQSVRDLFRVIRNKLNHFHQISKEVKNHIGKTPQGFIQYCLQLFPKLLHFAFVYTRKKKWKLHMK